jgi:hypothetical protein
MRSSPLAAAGLLAAALALPRAAHGLDRFEIQVYQAEINDPGQLGLELHLNYTLRGADRPEYPGEVPPDRVARLTLEPAIGVTDWLELGAYVQFMLAPGWDLRYGGVKLRAKFVVPEATQARLGLPVFLGLNVEVGRVPVAVEEQGWANEFRPIIGWKDDDWLVAVNPIFGYALTGPDRFRVDFEPCAKVAFNTQLGFAVGLEYYGGLGFIGDGFLPLQQQEHLLLGVVDLVDPARPHEAVEGSPAHASPWEVNLAFGGSLTDATGTRLVAKAIIGRSF